MKMMKLLLAMILPAGLIFTPCKKDDDPTPSNLDTYLPLTEGTSWSYHVSTSTAPASMNRDYTVTVLEETQHNGATWTELRTTIVTPSETFYVRIDNDGNIWQDGVYYENGMTTDLPPMIIFKEKADVGATWNYVFSLDGFSNTIYKYTIKEKGTTMTVNGLSFDNVARVEIEIGAEFQGTYLALGKYSQYLAKGVGLIFQEESSISVEVGIEDYDIK